jgi:hypothetical protein
MKKMSFQEKMSNQLLQVEVFVGGQAHWVQDLVRVMKNLLKEMLVSLEEQVLLILALPVESSRRQENLNPAQLEHRVGESLKERNLKTNKLIN